jgi:hypothetical protein
MKGKIVGTLFALPFFGVGVWMLWSISNTIYSAWEMQHWVQVEARLITAGYETRRGDDSDTYEAYARYSYSYGGNLYTGDRVTISSGGDNIGDYQTNIGSSLSGKLARGHPVIIRVDPDEPWRSIIDPGIRWGLLGFKSIFLFVFGGVGLGLLIFLWKAPKEKDASLPEYQDAPWLLNHDWETPTIRSSSRAAMWGAWAFAAFWNLISSVTPFMAYKEVTANQNYLALIALLFPLVGIGLITWAVRRTLEWRRFGPAPVTLDPFPGSIGGHVGGTIDLNLPYDSGARFQLTLTSLHSYISGSGKKRSRREEAQWQDEIVAHAEPGGKGTRLTFRFEVPNGLDETDALQKGDDYYLWRLNLSADLPGADLDRDYDIPVYATATNSRHLSNVAVERSRDAQNEIADARVRDIIRIRQGVMGRSLSYPMGRHLLSNLFGMAFGAAFAGAGYFLIVQEGATIFGGIFGGVGALVAISAFYMLSNSLEVTQDGSSIQTIRRWLGIPVGRKSMPRNHFVRFKKKKSMKTQQGGKHTVYYAIHLVDHSGNKLVVGEGFKGESEAQAAIRLIAKELGLRQDQERRDPQSGSSLFDEDVLTADF